MRNLAWVVLGVGVGLSAAACGSCPHAGAAEPAANEPAPQPAAALPSASASPAAGTTSSSGGERPATAALSADALQGSWVEYWALSGRAETQRYTFMNDGRFGWCAGPNSAAPATRWGRFSVAGDALVLTVQGEDAQHDCSGGACRKLHEPALEQRLPLGPCPPNDEARALDAHYRCVSVGGQAFWLGPSSSTASDAAAAALAK